MVSGRVRASRLTQGELRAIAEALSARLAGPLDVDEEATGIPPEAYESAWEKIEDRISRGPGARA